ncbi:hypothetical protein C8J57DRAFT_1507365 [Mycena rebaudengoi]|nr:hypothetical protein C8J57DRAFT_1507365 [Mycena rebaudengoi]
MRPLVPVSAQPLSKGVHRTYFSPRLFLFEALVRLLGVSLAVGAIHAGGDGVVVAGVRTQGMVVMMRTTGVCAPPVGYSGPARPPWRRQYVYGLCAQHGIDFAAQTNSASAAGGPGPHN